MTYALTHVVGHGAIAVLKDEPWTRGINLSANVTWREHEQHNDHNDLLNFRGQSASKFAPQKIIRKVRCLFVARVPSYASLLQNPLAILLPLTAARSHGRSCMVMSSFFHFGKANTPRQTDYGYTN